MALFRAGGRMNEGSKEEKEKTMTGPSWIGIGPTSTTREHNNGDRIIKKEDSQHVAAVLLSCILLLSLG